MKFILFLKHYPCVVIFSSSSILHACGVTIGYDFVFSFQVLAINKYYWIRYKYTTRI